MIPILTVLFCFVFYILTSYKFPVVGMLLFLVVTFTFVQSGGLRIVCQMQIEEGGLSWFKDS